MSEYFILDGHEVKPAADVVEWAQWFETAQRQLGDYMREDIRVSTVFLGIDHRFGEGPPLIFETMVFGGPLDGETDRYSTYDEAEAGHGEMVKRVEAAGGGVSGAGERGRESGEADSDGEGLGRSVSRGGGGGADGGDGVTSVSGGVVSAGDGGGRSMVEGKNG